MQKLAMVSYNPKLGIEDTLRQLSALTGKDIQWVDLPEGSEQDNTVTVDGEEVEYGSLDVLIEGLGCTIIDVEDFDVCIVLLLATGVE